MSIDYLNSKFQITSSKQISNSKPQIPNVNYGLILGAS